MKGPSWGIQKRLASVRAWELPRQPSALAPDDVWVGGRRMEGARSRKAPSDSEQTNRDMDPTPPEDQTWTVWSIMAYWATDTINLGTWETAASILDVGLSWREALPIMVAGTLCVAVPMVLNGAIGAKMHVPFSVITTSAFGFRLRYFAIISRAVLAMFWLGIQGANGAQCITVMIRAWAPSYRDMANHLPASAGITTQGMVSYFLFWMVQLPLLLMPPNQLRPLFVAKLVGAPVAAVATMGWCIHRAGGGGDIFALHADLTGSEYAWRWLRCMSAVTGSWATLACNIPDFTRYVRSAKGQYVQLPFLPLVFTLCGLLGIVTSSATKVFAGSYMWNPLDIAVLWLDNGPGGRCAAFFAALAWYVAQVGTNITANSISAANDLTVLLPRWINIRRGCIVAAFVAGWALVPWKIVHSAQTLLDFMGGYSVFLAPIAGIICADYWLVKRQRLDIPALYNPRGRYVFIAGCNLHAAVAFLVPVVSLLPGLVNAVGGVPIAAGAQNLYVLNWLFGFVVSIVLYAGLSRAFPDGVSLVDETVWDRDPVSPGNVLQASKCTARSLT